MPGKCAFNILWLENANYKDWLSAVPANKQRAKCKLCLKEFDIAKMGEAALRSHMKGTKHMELLKSKSQSHMLKELFSPTVPGSSTSTTGSALAESPVPDVALSSYVVKSDVLDAEILWSLKCIDSLYSYNSCEGTNQLFSKMFKDSSIARQFSCGATKCSYLICFGLGPYFKSVLLKELKDVDFYTVLFDETLNQSLQSKQMDIMIRYVDKDDVVKTRYIASDFLGHSTAGDILTAFRNCMVGLNMNKILQLSMDGPHVNWKFFDNLQSELKKEYSHEVLTIGSCGLHILNNAFKYGESSTEWNLSEILSALYWIFKDSPARTADFLSVSSFKKLPLKFCKCRWLENAPAVERAIEIWADIVAFVKNVEKGKFSKINNKSYKLIKEAIKDKLIEVKLNVFLSISKIIQPFLSLYQNDAPLLPFFSDDTLKLCRNLIQYFNVYKEEHHQNFSNAVKLCNFSFSDEKNFNSVDCITLGFISDNAIKKLLKKNSSLAREAFDIKIESRSFVVKLLEKLVSKCPINYGTVRNASCIDPRKMALYPESCQESLKCVLRILSDRKIVLENECDNIILEYKNFLDDIVAFNRSCFENFSPSDDRLDTFFRQFIFKDKKSYQNIFKVMKLIFTLSHGQASIERGFSVNKNIEVENMSEETYVSQRLVKQAIKCYDDLLSIPITEDMRRSVSSARQRYLLNFENKRKNKKNEEKEKKRKAVSEEIDYLKSKKVCLASDVAQMEKACDSMSQEAEEKKNIDLFIKSNTMRKSINVKVQEIKDIESKLKECSEELRKCD